MYKLRKVVSALASTLMIGSTVALAGAATFPAPFVQSGTANYAVVYGAATSNTGTDFIAAQDISTSLSAALASTVTTSSTSTNTTTVTGGDFVQLEKANNMYNLGEAANTFFTSMDDDQLGTVLAEGTFRNADDDDFDYTQKIALGTFTLKHFQDNDFNDEMPSIGFDLVSGTHILNYTLDFTTAAQGGAGLAKLENEELEMLGKTYYILDATNTTGTNHKLTLLDAANTVTVAEGETKTVDVGGQSYEVGISFISSSEVVLTVNGANTRSLSDGSTAKLSGDVYIGIKDIRAQDYAGGLKQVEFSIGAGKIVLQNGQEVEINGDIVSDGTDSKITSYLEFSGNDLDKIILDWESQEDQWIDSNTELVMPGLNAIKLFMGNFVTPTEETTKIVPDGDNSVKLSTTVTDGPVSFNLFFTNSTDILGLGKDTTSRLVTNTTGTDLTASKSILFDTDMDDYFVATWISGDDAESYVLKVSSISSTSSLNTTKVKSLASDSIEEITLNDGDTDNFGSIDITLIESNDAGNFAHLNLSVPSGTVYVDRLVTADGLLMKLPVDRNASATWGDNHMNISMTPASYWYMNFTEETEDGNIGAGDSFRVKVGLVGGETTVTGFESEAVLSTGSDYETEDGSKDYVGYVESPLATKTLLRTGGDQDDIEITYHGEESYGEVYVGEAEVSAGGETPQLGSLIVTDSQISSVENKNLVVVGGSCVNTVAASLLGVSYPLCGADFTAKTNVAAGQYLIQTFESPYNSARVATLVAGYNAADTTNAATYFRTQTGVMTDADTKYIGTTSDSAEIVTQLN